MFSRTSVCPHGVCPGGCVRWVCPGGVSESVWCAGGGGSPIFHRGEVSHLNARPHPPPHTHTHKQETVGTHLTGMHSCYLVIFVKKME